MTWASSSGENSVFPASKSLEQEAMRTEGNLAAFCKDHNLNINSEFISKALIVVFSNSKSNPEIV